MSFDPVDTLAQTLAAADYPSHKLPNDGPQMSAFREEARKILEQRKRTDRYDFRAVKALQDELALEITAIIGDHSALSRMTKEFARAKMRQVGYDAAASERLGEHGDKASPMVEALFWSYHSQFINGVLARVIANFQSVA